MNDDIVTELKSTTFIATYPLQSRLILQVYLDLKMLKEWKFIQLKEHKIENICYLQGKKDAEEQVILPVGSNEPISPARFLHLFDELFGNSQTKNQMINLGIVDSDSSVSYYRIYNSLIPPNE